MDAYIQTLEWIYNLRGGVIDLRLDRMDRALALFDHPEKQFPSLHIAGTNGKGSTAAMLHRILRAAGYRTALYTSPHLVSFTERIRVDEQEITPEEVVALAAEIKRRIDGAGIALTYFEIVTVMAMVYFARQRLDAAVVEVGLGGRLDATNLVRPVVTAITTIARDHEAYLGSDLQSIAREKAGIIKRDVPVICGGVSGEVRSLIADLAERQEAPPYFLGADFGFLLKDGQLFDYKGRNWQFSDLQLALRGRHQRANASVALAALEMAAGAFPVSEQAAREGLRSVAWPGRFEVLSEGPTLILDGAHNGEGVDALVVALREFLGDKKVKLLFAAMEDKNWRSMLETLLPLVDELMLTRVDMERCADPARIADSLAKTVRTRVETNAAKGLTALFNEAETNGAVLVAGSLYLLGEVRPTALALVEQRQSGGPAR